MAGKTTKPLKILAHRTLRGSPEISELLAKGHEVLWMDEREGSFNLILGPTSWRMTPELLKYLPDAVKGAREQVYGTKYK